MGKGDLGRQPRHASRDLSAIADFYHVTLCVSGPVSVRAVSRWLKLSSNFFVSPVAPSF